MNGDNYGWESSLSMVANEQSRSARQRHGVTLLRPVFMNAVEVGYSYAHCDRDKKLNVRGVTIALWHFICRGHQAIALLPYCFKNYAEKTSRYSELMMLYRLNLIEFTPGYGSEKYAEVNRIMVNRAYETGGCLVARSQMQGITDNKTHLIDVVEQRLLMPTFNGDDIMFPIDGPLGRNGPSLKQTLECEQGSADWRSCSEHQLLLSDQRHWLEKLALLVPEKVPWTRMVQVIQAGGEMTLTGGHLDGFDPLYETEPPVPVTQPPLENPFNRTISTTNEPQEYLSSSPPPIHHHSQHQHQHHHHQPNPHQHHLTRRQSFDASPSRRYSNCHAVRHHSTTRHILRYGPTAEGPTGVTHHRVRSKHSATTDSVESTASTQSGGTGEQESMEVDEDVARTLNVQLMEEARREEEQRVKVAAEQKKKDEALAKLSQIFGYSKAFRVMNKFPRIQTFCLLVEKCIQEEDEDGDGREFADVWTEEEQVVETETVPVPENGPPITIPQEDLIDFSEEPIIENNEQDGELSTDESPLVDLMS